MAACMHAFVHAWNSLVGHSTGLVKYHVDGCDQAVIFMRKLTSFVLLRGRAGGVP